MPSALLVLVDRCNKRLFLDRSFERFNRFGRGLELDPFGISSLDISNRLSNGLGSFRGGFGCSLLLLLDRVRRPVVGSFGRSSGFLLGNGFGAFWFGVRRLLYRNFTIAWEDCRKVVPATTFTLASTDGCSRSYENGSKEEDETCKLRNVAEEGREHLGGDFSCGVDVVGSWLFQDENNKPIKKNSLILILCGRAACCRFVSYYSLPAGFWAAKSAFPRHHRSYYYLLRHQYTIGAVFRLNGVSELGSCGKLIVDVY